MKRFILILAVAVLLLTGCAGQVPSEPTVAPTDPVPTQPDTLATFYVPESSAEKDTLGAVKKYAPDTGIWRGILDMGTDLLLTGEGQILHLDTAGAMPVTRLSLNWTQMDVSTTGVACYVPESNSVTVMNPRLQVTATLKLPEEMAGTPVINLLRSEVYYIADSEIRAINWNTGISRLLRQQTDVAELLPEVCFDGSVLVLRVSDTDGTARTEFISAVTGQTLGGDSGILEMSTWADRYFLRRKDGRMEQMLFGTRAGDTKLFSAAGTVFPMLRMNGVAVFEETGDGLRMSFVDLNTGKCVAKTQTRGLAMPVSVCSDGTYIWFLAEEDKTLSLYCWDIAKSSAQEETLYTDAFYTPENPNTEGLAACQTLADTYAQKYGVKLNIWKNATITTGGYTVTAEYQPETIREMLEELRFVLEVFPENFLLKTVEAGWIRINLVREIQGGKQWAHMWKGKDCHILISADGDAGDLFLQAVAYAVDSHVLGNSRDFDADRWTPLNPADFTYGQIKTEYLLGDTRAFANEKAMTSILEDRCSIFYNAIIGGNSEMFKAPIMQAKLLRLCMGIREAYGLQKSEKTYLWERYLETSLAYKK